MTGTAEAHYFNLHPKQSLEYSLRAIELDQCASQLQVERYTRAYWTAVRDLITLGDIQRAWPYAATQLELAEQQRDRFGLALGLHANEILAHLQGD